MNIKVSIADDHPVVANGIKNILNDFKHLEVLAVYPNGNALLQGIKALQPDVLLLDMNLPDTEGAELARTITKLYSTVKILVFSSSDITIQVKKMLQAGAAGYLLKESDDVTIVKAIETVYNGGQFLSPAIQQAMVDDMFKNKNRPKQAVLTRREKEVLQLIVAEHTNQEIADKLFISPHTVDNHRINLLQKLNVKNTAGLVKVALQNGLVD